MTNLETLLALAVVLLSLVVAFLSATIPALWWVHLRQLAKHEIMVAESAELAVEIAKLDEVVYRVSKMVGLEERT
jgi:hypothetical protein